ncbi:MAG: hypothetical protein NWE93_01915 [Candidatus Bathyarchaeota archaeon]|nr:hypothetical protein [Candidatus Bathyarchaeota archaeon]
MKQNALAAALVLALLTSALGSLTFYESTSANPGGGFPPLSMPVEYVNYTIVDVDGVWWAKIDGSYPISLKGNDCGFSAALPMLYPMPPNATNIHVSVDGHELGWSDYPASERHQTAIGNWTMIYCTIDNAKESFLLSIHYEHPIEQINGSSIFLYDLNISPYLSAQSPQSTAYFTFYFQKPPGEVQVYTAPPQSAPNQWQPENFSQTTEENVSVVLVEMHSQFGEALPGDLAVVFSGADVDEVPGATLPPTGGDADLVWLIPVVVGVVLVAAAILVKRKAVSSFNKSRKNPK